VKTIFSISMDPQILKELDNSRGNIPRSRYIEIVIDEVLKRKNE